MTLNRAKELLYQEMLRKRELARVNQLCRAEHLEVYEALRLAIKLLDQVVVLAHKFQRQSNQKRGN